MCFFFFFAKFFHNKALYKCKYKDPHTLSSNNEAGHAIRNAGSSCQKSDAHDHFWDPESEADYGHLRKKHAGNTLLAYLRACRGSRACRRASHHPDHEVGEQSYPKRGSQEGEQVPALPLWQAAVGDGAVEQDTHGPRQQPPQTLAPPACTHKIRTSFPAGIITESARVLNASQSSHESRQMSTASMNSTKFATIKAKEEEGNM